MIGTSCRKASEGEHTNRDSGRGREPNENTENNGDKRCAHVGIRDLEMRMGGLGWGTMEPGAHVYTNRIELRT